MFVIVLNSKSCLTSFTATAVSHTAVFFFAISLNNGDSWGLHKPDESEFTKNTSHWCRSKV